MSRWGLLTSVAAAGIAAATAASAADLPVGPGPSYYPAPAYAPALYNWTGIYFGANIGVGDLQDTTTTTTTTVFQGAGAKAHLSDLGVIGGPQLGINYEMTPVVVGLEASWSATNLSASSDIGSALPTDAERSTSNINWYATATARVGYAFDTLLVYAKGGAAWMHAEYVQTDLATPALAFVSNQSIQAMRMGFVVGGGFEYGLTEHLSGRIEYEFLDFGTKTYNFGGLTTSGGIGVGPFPVSITSYTHRVTAGMYYRFD